MNRSIAGLLALALWAFSPMAAIAAEPVEIEARDFGNRGRDMVPTGATLTAAEERTFLASVRSHNFPAYLYSGCQERAHAAYLMLPASLRPKIMKVWVAAPATLAPAIGGTVRLRAPDAASARVSWDFHVALAYRSAAGLRIVDLGLAPNQVLTRSAWHGMLDVPPLSVALLTDGAVYSFIQIGTDDYSKNSLTWNGNFFYYTRPYHEERWIPRALARDQIGALALAGGSCAPIRALISRPGPMQRFLMGKDPEDNNGVRPADPQQLELCRESIAQYDAARERWAALIPVQQPPAASAAAGTASGPLPRIAELPAGSYHKPNSMPCPAGFTPREVDASQPQVAQQGMGGPATQTWCVPAG